MEDMSPQERPIIGQELLTDSSVVVRVGSRLRGVAGSTVRHPLDVFWLQGCLPCQLISWTFAFAARCPFAEGVTKQSRPFT